MIRYSSFCVVCAVMIVCAALCPVSADTVAGTLLSLSPDSRTLMIKDGLQTRKVTLNAGTKVLRGQVGKTQAAVAVKELAPGDRVLAVTGADNSVTVVRASYAVIAGIVDRTVDRKIVLKQGKAIFLHKNAQIALASGKFGLMSDVKSGAFVICRLEPLSKECWTVVVSGSQSTASAQTKTNTPKPQTAAIVKAPSVPANPAVKFGSGPQINGVTIQASPSLSSGDVVIVELIGTPKGVAKAEIRGIAGPAALKETTPGVYKGAIPIRTTSVVRDAVVTGYLSLNGKPALPAQAKNRVNLNLPIKKKLPSPVEMPKVDLTPPAPPPAPVIEPPKPVEPPKPPEAKPIVLAVPLDFADVTDNVTVSGTANPGDKVLVQISYSNGRTGLLNIAGDVASQLVAVTEDGSFRFGPLPLSGILQTKGMQYNIVVRYTDHPEKPIESRVIYGHR